MPSRNASRRPSGTNEDTTAEIQRLGVVADNGGVPWMKQQSMNYNDVNAIMEEDVEKFGNTPMKGPFAKLSIGSLVSVIVIGVASVFLLGACLIVAIHRIQEGHVGLYYRNGRLIDATSDPGIHWLQPFVTSVVQIRLTPETKTMDPLVCTTRDGVRNVFRDVQIITSLQRDEVLGLVRQYTPKLKRILVYERVSEAIQIFCANNSIDEVYNTRFLEIVEFVNTTLHQNLNRLTPNGGLVIWNIFLPKPDVPPAIAANYREVKVEWTRQLVSQQKQRTQKILKETERIKAVADAERLKEIQAIDISKDIQQEEGKANISSIWNDRMAKKRRIDADVSSYVSLSEAESNKELLSDNYVKLQIARNLGNNTKMYFSGQDSALGAILGSVFKQGL